MYQGRSVQWLAIGFFLLLIGFANAQPLFPSTLLFNPSTGTNINNLNGKWHIIIDPYDNGFYNYRYEESPTGYFKNKIAKLSELVEYSFDHDNTLHVPADWNSQQDQLLFYEGTIWYKRDFEFQPQAGKKTYLHFGAINYESWVYVNGEKVGHHVGGFTPFAFDVSSKLKPGKNFVVVRADNRRKKEGIPTLNTDWWNYGGITRDVNLVSLPEKHVTDFRIALHKTKDELVGKVVTSAPNQTVEISIAALNWKQTITTNTQNEAVFTAKVKPVLWSPSQPKLYEVTLVSNGVTLTDKIGFRRLSTTPNSVVLNGKPLFLKGICMHEENPLKQGRATSISEATMLLGWAKELGCNYMRLAHYPHNEYMLRKADELGIVIWAEIPLYWTIDWSNNATYELAQQQYKEMVDRDFNRAAIGLWGLANETPVSTIRTQFLGNLATYVRSMDSTRLVSAALEVHSNHQDKRVIDDPLGAYLDVLGCNEYLSWYDDRKVESLDTIQWSTTYKKPLIISELGADALFGNHGDKKTRFTEEYQAEFYTHQLAMLSKINFLTGMSPWILADFRSPRRPLPVIQDFWNRKGLLSERGEKKQAWYLLQQYYLKR